MSAVPISMMDVNELVRQVRFLFVELLPGQYLRHEACCDALTYEVLTFFFCGSTCGMRATATRWRRLRRALRCRVVGKGKMIRMRF